MKKINLFAMSIITGSLLASAQEKEAVVKTTVETLVMEKDVQGQNKMSDANLVNNATDSMEDWGDDVLGQFGLDGWGLTDDGKYFLFASQTTSVKNTDPQYGDALVNAFDKAMMKAQEEYLMMRFGRIATEKIKSYFSDRSTNAREIPLPEPTDSDLLDKLMKVVSKKLDLAGKKLDKKLIEMGEDPASLASLTPVQKKTLFSDTFFKDTIQKASGGIAGMFPIQTCVITDKKGRTSVGVALVASDKTIQVAKDITLKRKSNISGKGRDIKTLIPRNKEKFISTLGTRLVYDQEGRPAILSYGIASYRPDTGNDYINEELRSQAKKQAETNANAQIAEAIAGRMNAKNATRNGEQIKQTVEREMKADAESVEKTMTNIIKIVNNNAKNSAKASLQGITTIKRWRYTAPTGQEFVGSVRSWTYDALDAVRSFNSNKTKRSASSTKKVYESEKNSSEAVNDLNDF